MVGLQGPSEAKFGSKQDYHKAFIEIMLKMPDRNVQNYKELKREIKSDLHQCLEQIIQTTAYAKQVLSFQVTVVQDTSYEAS